MIAALLQYNPVYLDVQANLAFVERAIDGLSSDLVVLPELFASGYNFQRVDELRRVAEPIPDGPTCETLLKWSRSTGTTFVAGLPEQYGDEFFNSAVVVAPEGVIGTYRKVHLFNREKLFFSPGDLGFLVVDVATRAGASYRLGVMICFDWYFPEAARALALKGADVIAHPSNLVRKDCPRAMPIRALENHVFTITANRYGTEAGEHDLTFIGQSVVCGPEGDVLFAADREGDAIGVVEFDPLTARNRRITAMNDLFADRLPEEYGTLTTTALRTNG